VTEKRAIVAYLPQESRLLLIIRSRVRVPQGARKGSILLKIEPFFF